MDKRRICIIPLFLRFHRKMNKQNAAVRGGSFRSILSIRLIKLAHLHNVSAALPSRCCTATELLFVDGQTLSYLFFTRTHNLPSDGFPKRKLGANVIFIGHLSKCFIQSRLSLNKVSARREIHTQHCINKINGRS